MNYSYQRRNHPKEKLFIRPLFVPPLGGVLPKQSITELMKPVSEDACVWRLNSKTQLKETACSEPGGVEQRESKAPLALSLCWGGSLICCTSPSSRGKSYFWASDDRCLMSPIFMQRCLFSTKVTFKHDQDNNRTFLQHIYSSTSIFSINSKPNREPSEYHKPPTLTLNWPPVPQRAASLSGQKILRWSEELLKLPELIAN